MRLILSLTAASLALAGCVAPVTTPAPPPVVVVPTPAPGPAPLGTAQRAAATTVVNQEMARVMPGVNIAPYTACVINNATMAELADLAAMAGGSRAGASSAVAAIVNRPAASQCIAGVPRTA